MIHNHIVKPSFDNSFYHQQYDGTALIIVPHEDDEINVAGNLIWNLSRGGAEVHVLYTTNGDWKTKADTRVGEAVAALSVLGVHKENIHFLGYGDSLNTTAGVSLFYHPEGKVLSPAGHSETYAGVGFSDFAFELRGEHSSYNSTCFLRDLTDFIQTLRPNLLVCVDYDQHADHRMLSLFFDRAVHSLLREDPAYRPQILKRFAYALAYTAKADFFNLNNPSTQRPNERETGRYLFDLIDKAGYLWDERIRMPIAVSAAERRLDNNLLAKALACHRSQFILSRADRIINADEVFWERRTDNLALLCRVEATSGDPRPAVDGLIFDTEDIDSKKPVFGNDHWQPAADDEQKELRLIWDEDVELSRLRIYGRIRSEGQIGVVRVSFGDGTFTDSGPIDKEGKPLEIILANSVTTKELRVRLLHCTGDDYGITEIEVFNDRRQLRGFIGPFIKMMINDDFAYEYYVPDREEKVELELYSFGEIRRESIRFEILGGRGIIADGNTVLLQDQAPVIVRATAETVEGNTVFDQIVLGRADRPFQKKLKRLQIKDAYRLKTIDRIRKIVVWKRYLEDHGVVYSISKVIEKAEKIIKKR